MKALAHLGSANKVVNVFNDNSAVKSGMCTYRRAIEECTKDGSASGLV